MPNYSGTNSQNVRPEQSYSLPTGAVIPAGIPTGAPASSIPNGFLLCDGAAYLRADYPALFALIGTVYGDGSRTNSGGNTIASGFSAGTAFNVPDYRGRFQRGSNAINSVSSGRDNSVVRATVNVQTGAGGNFIHANHGFHDNEPIIFTMGSPQVGAAPAPIGIGTTYYVQYVNKDQYGIRSTPGGGVINITNTGATGYVTVQHALLRTPNMPGGQTGDLPGTVQQDAFQGHFHAINSADRNAGEGGSGSTSPARWTAATNYLVQARDMISDGSSGTIRATRETRPVNIALLYLIRAY